MAGLSPAHVREVGRLASAGDVPALVAKLIEISATNEWLWVHHGGPVVDVLAKLDGPVAAEVLTGLLDRVGAFDSQADRLSIIRLVAQVGERASEAIPADVAGAFLRQAGRTSTFWPSSALPAFVAALQRAGRPLPDEAVAMIRRTAHGDNYGAPALRPLARALPGPVLNCGEAWADRARADLPGLGGGWTDLVAHAATATSAKPTAQWERRAGELLAAMPAEEVGDRLRTWLALVGRPRTVPLFRSAYEYDVNESFDPYNATVLRGLIWLTVHLPEHPDTARVLGGLVDTSLRKVAGLGPRSPKIANSAVQALARTGTPAALGQLARLTARVTHKGTLKELDKALEATARDLGLTREEVEELAVPAYGLTGVGHRVDHFSDVTAELAVTGGRTTIAWRTSAGRVVKAPPAAVRSDHAEELKELKAAARDIDQMLSAQADRLDRQFLAQRVWEHAAWRERYLDHPLLGTLARRLIWVVGDQPVGYADGELRGHDDRPAGTVAGPTPVRLWHPIGRPVDEVVAWRDWLERHGVTQPFKQAHREVYLLTAAEENTATYSNRFAAHILRQHQFHALAAVRGWTNRLRLMVDDTYPPATRDLPGWGLRAEFWVEGVGDDYGTDTTESGAFLRLATDQVRFYPTAAPVSYAHASGGRYEQWVRGDEEPTDALPLAGVPALVFSEVMRDVDLFVGVASVGNDPTWQDGGPEGRFRTYWEHYSFGELGATAQTRRDLLERLVPRLAIADRARVSGNFLEVRGNLRTYRIHLGSGNILMSPNDQYLCIVPKQAPDAPDSVFLPFEGDRVLALILSKALMLAKDDRITDSTIVRQIRF